MTTFQSLPKEVLSMIFKDLGFFELMKCQVQCRSWYAAAHILLLKDIVLFTPKQVSLFAQSIEQNPDPAYLAGVKRICLSYMIDTNPKNIYIDDDAILKGLLRFPNLKTLIISNEKISTRILTQERLRDELVRNSSKIQSLIMEVNESMEKQYLELAYQFRHTLTDLELYNNIPDSFTSAQHFVTQFPHLRGVSDHSDHHLETIEKILPIIEKLPFWTSMLIGPGRDDTDAFDRRYSDKTAQTAQFIDRLSKITRIVYTFIGGPYLNSTRFLHRYCTGLQDFRILGLRNDNWTDDEASVFCTDILAMATSFQSSCIRLNPSLEVLATCFSPLVEKIFYKSPFEVEKHFELDLQDNPDAPMPFALRMESLKVTENVVERKINLKFLKMLDIMIFFDVFRTLLPGLESFTFHIADDIDDRQIRTFRPILREILRLMPSLQHAFLPPAFEDLAEVVAAEFRSVRNPHM